MKLPASVFANPEDAAKNPEDVLDFVPGECWVRLLLLVAEDDDDDAAAFENLLKVLVSGLTAVLVLMGEVLGAKATSMTSSPCFEEKLASGCHFYDTLSFRQQSVGK